MHTQRTPKLATQQLSTAQRTSWPACAQSAGRSLCRACRKRHRGIRSADTCVQAKHIGNEQSSSTGCASAPAGGLRMPAVDSSSNCGHLATGKTRCSSQVVDDCIQVGAAAAREEQVHAALRRSTGRLCALSCVAAAAGATAGAGRGSLGAAAAGLGGSRPWRSISEAPDRCGRAAGSRRARPPSRRAAPGGLQRCRVHCRDV